MNIPNYGRPRLPPTNDRLSRIYRNRYIFGRSVSPTPRDSDLNHHREIHVYCIKWLIGLCHIFVNKEILTLRTLNVYFVLKTMNSCSDFVRVDTRHHDVCLKSLYTNICLRITNIIMLPCLSHTCEFGTLLFNCSENVVTPKKNCYTPAYVNLRVFLYQNQQQ